MDKSKLLALAVAVLVTVLAAATVANALLYAETKDAGNLITAFVNLILITVAVVAHGIHEDNRRAARQKVVRASMDSHPTRNQSGL